MVGMNFIHDFHLKSCRLLHEDAENANLQRVYLADESRPGSWPRLLLMATRHIGKGAELVL